jgi:hypothetical protein
MDKAFAQLHNTFKEEIAKSTEQMQNYIGYEAGGLKVGPGSQSKSFIKETLSKAKL